MKFLRFFGKSWGFWEVFQIFWKKSLKMGLFCGIITMRSEKC